jgi:hypothetical protein
MNSMILLEGRDHWTGELQDEFEETEVVTTTSRELDYGHDLQGCAVLSWVAAAASAQCAMREYA